MLGGDVTESCPEGCDTHEWMDPVEAHEAAQSQETQNGELHETLRTQGNSALNRQDADQAAWQRQTLDSSGISA